MNLADYKREVTGVLGGTNLGFHINRWINSVRDEICSMVNIGFQQIQRTIPAVNATYEYSISPANGQRFCRHIDLFYTPITGATTIKLLPSTDKYFRNNSQVPIGGTPSTYKVLGSRFYLDRASVTAAMGEAYIAVYAAFPELLEGDADHFELDDNYPTAVVVGSCRRACRFLPHLLEQLPGWSAEYQQELAKIKAIETSTILDFSALAEQQFTAQGE